MTNEEFQRWLAGVEQLTVAQRERLQQVAQEQGDEAASLAAIELRVDARRCCPRCGAGGAVDLQRKTRRIRPKSLLAWQTWAKGRQWPA